MLVEFMPDFIIPCVIPLKAASLSSKTINNISWSSLLTTDTSEIIASAFIMLYVFKRHSCPWAAQRQSKWDATFKWTITGCFSKWRTWSILQVSKARYGRITPSCGLSKVETVEVVPEKISIRTSVAQYIGISVYLIDSNISYCLLFNSRGSRLFLREWFILKQYGCLSGSSSVG